MGKKKDAAADAPVEKKVTKKPAVKEVPAVVETTTNVNMSNLAHVLQNPRITEKATTHAEESVYVFDVAESATKRMVMQAVFVHYKVRPRMIRVVTIPTKVKRSMRTGKTGVKHGGKKAYVYLKKGEQITIS